LMGRSDMVCLASKFSINESRRSTAKRNAA
jgi:hypothetical protein